jgi:hypothetical protein
MLSLQPSRAEAARHPGAVGVPRPPARLGAPHLPSCRAHVRYENVSSATWQWQPLFGVARRAGSFLARNFFDGSPIREAGRPPAWGVTRHDGALLPHNFLKRPAAVVLLQFVRGAIRWLCALEIRRGNGTAGIRGQFPKERQNAGNSS